MLTQFLLPRDAASAVVARYLVCLSVWYMAERITQCEKGIQHPQFSDDIDLGENPLGRLAAHLTQCGLRQGPPPYQVAS